MEVREEYRAVRIMDFMVHCFRYLGVLAAPKFKWLRHGKQKNPNISILSKPVLGNTNKEI
jgi:hypothetical protein